MRTVKFLLLFFLMNGWTVFAQGDIGELLIDVNKKDSVGLDAALQLSKYYSNKNADSANYFADIALNHDWIKPNSEIYYKAHLSKANALYSSGNIKKSKEFYLKALEIAKKLNLNKYISQTLIDIGWLEREMGNSSVALDYFYQSLEIAEKANDQSTIARVYGRIAIIYHDTQEKEKSIEYYKKSIDMYKELNDTAALASNYNNYALIFLSNEEIDSAMKYFNLAMDYNVMLGNKKGVAINNENIGIIYSDHYDNYEVAIEYYERSLNFWKKNNDDYGIAQCQVYIAKTLLEMKEYNSSEQFCLEAIKHAEKASVAPVSRDAYNILYQVYESTGKIEKAFESYKNFIKFKNDIFNENKIREITTLELESDFNQKRLKDSILRAEEKEKAELKLAKKEIEIEQKRNLTFVLSSALFVFLVLIALVFRAFKKKKTLSELVSSQKEVLKAKNNDILDSINYAKRLQDAILPSKNSLNKNLKNGFVMYQPKDIVSGDFYYMNVVEEKDEKIIYFAVADCTGHGVPGAMVSIVGANAINRCINEFGLRKPGEILDKLSELVADNFAQSEEKIRDGLDISLVAYHDVKPSKSSQASENLMRYRYAGANNPLWVINPNRTTWPDNMKVFKNGGGAEIKGFKQSIGYSENKKTFPTHEIQLQKGDTIYLFSDGYPDQFGGEELNEKKAGGKKFKTANFKKLLCSIYKLPMNEQKGVIIDTFNKWKGELEQIDDVCIIGVRV